MGTTQARVRRGHTSTLGRLGGTFDFRTFNDGDLTLASTEVIDEQRLIATDPTTDWEILLRMSYARDRLTALWLSENPSSTADILDISADVLDPTVRKSIARHPRTIEETLTVLLTDVHEDVRAEVAVNPRLLRRDQMTASVDTSVLVQRALLANPKLDVVAADNLRHSTFAEIRTRMSELNAYNTQGAQR